jgi:hypothetical protein
LLKRKQKNAGMNMKKWFGMFMLLSVMGLAACDGSGTDKNIDDCDENPADCQVPEDAGDSED